MTLAPRAPIAPIAPPADALAAVTHPDPYPAYARWRAGPPLAWDAGLRLWVATRADVIERLLAAPQLRVRPAAEPVPAAIAGGAAGELFGHLVRMNDGAAHAAWRPVLQRALAGLDLAEAHACARELALATPTGTLDDAIVRLPLQAVAHALGFARDALPQVVDAVRDFVACLSPLSTAAQLAAAQSAAATLMARMAQTVAARPAREATLLQAVLAQAPERAHGAPPLLANLVGLMSQTCEATAALLGQALLAAAREGGALPAGPALQAWLEEVARHDAPVQNTRRFVAEPCELEGQALAPGQAVLLVLAAGHRDPAFNADPDRFDAGRPQRRLLGFGHGAHACPGQALAFALAGGALRVLHAQGRHLEAAAAHGGRYRPSVNARIPRFGLEVM